MGLRVEQQPAFILHARPYRETSLLVDLLTLDYGKVSAVIRSARGPRSRFKNCCQMFTPLTSSWSQHNELVTITNIETMSMPIDLRGRILFSALYLNELLVRLLQRFDPHSQIYQLYQTTLSQLAMTEDVEAPLRLFEKNLLLELGYALLLDREASNHKLVQAEKKYLFDPQCGPIAINNSSEQHSRLFSGHSLLALHHENLNDKVCLRDAKRLMRLALATLLGDKPLKTRELFVRKINYV